MPVDDRFDQETASGHVSPNGIGDVEEAKAKREANRHNHERHRPDKLDPERNSSHSRYRAAGRLSRKGENVEGGRERMSVAQTPAVALVHQ